jgi:hypothetical protein
MTMRRRGGAGAGLDGWGTGGGGAVSIAVIRAADQSEQGRASPQGNGRTAPVQPGGCHAGGPFGRGLRSQARPVVCGCNQKPYLNRT